LPASAINAGETVIETEVVPVQPKSVSVTVYVIDEEGSAVTTVPVVTDKPVDGAHEKEPAPVAVKITESPVHKVTGFGVTLTVGIGFTVTVIVFTPVHPAVVPVTVYVVVAEGLAITVEPVVMLSPEDGDHK